MNLNRRTFLQRTAVAGAGLAIPFSLSLPKARAQVAAAAQVPLPGSAIPQFVDPLPDLLDSLEDGTTGPLEFQMTEFQSMVMPSTFVPAAVPPAVPVRYTGTWVWGYRALGAAGLKSPSSYIGPVVLAKRGTPTEIKFVNNLPPGAASNLPWSLWTDLTLHWANPNGDPMMANAGHYTGPIPAVPHLHGGEIPPCLDGGPDAWFTSDGLKVGHAYYSKDGLAAKNYSIYRYPNTQEASPIWFHDHGLGITRLNVYAGIAGAYLIGDDGAWLPPGLDPYGIGGEVVIPIVLQDRMFDTNGQLYFPNLGINPEHPYWIPEFLGDTIVVNGKVWPTIGTALAPKPAKRYRFLFLNGSNARTYEMFLEDAVSGAMGPPIWVIGTDGGYLDAPAKLDPALGQKLVMMPGERYEAIIDFGGAYANRSYILRNTGRSPYPRGGPPQGATLGRIVKFFIGAPPAADTGYNPAGGLPLRTPMVRLVNPTTGAAAVMPSLTRQLTLNEVMGLGGPLEVLVNNTKWDGHTVAVDKFPGGVRPDFTLGLEHTYYSELPNEGDTELWEIINLTADAHPIHTHLVQFQLMNRQSFNFNKYNKAYNALFPGSTIIDPMTGLPFPAGVFIGGFGPPLDYNTGGAIIRAGGAPAAIVGGNPNVTPFLQGPVMPPLPQEAGWKDTVVMYPGQVTRIMVRWAPTSVAAGVKEGFPFDPNGGHGYVFHCHIIDHEDNEMMRPNAVVSLESQGVPVTRGLTKGVDY